MKARNRSGCSPCKSCDGQSGIGTDISRNKFFLSLIIALMFNILIHSAASVGLERQRPNNPINKQLGRKTHKTPRVLMTVSFQLWIIIDMQVTKSSTSITDATVFCG
jgi:hypothetical protein